MAKLSAYSKSPLLVSIEGDALKSVMSMMEAKLYYKAEFVFLECDVPTKIYLVESGKVKIFKQSEGGREIIIDIIMPGQLFGEVAALDGGPYDLSAQAIEDCKIKSISRDEFFTVLSENPDAATRLLSHLGARLREAQSMVLAMASERAEWRIARALVNLCKKVCTESSEGEVIDIPITRRDLADMAGTTVETAIRVMSKFKKDGICGTKRGRILILDKNRLQSMVNEGCEGWFFE